LATLASGPNAWEKDETVRRAIEIQDGLVKNPNILSFQHRKSNYPYSYKDKKD
jgi:hypothetical protein